MRDLLKTLPYAWAENSKSYPSELQSGDASLIGSAEGLLPKRVFSSLSLLAHNPYDSPTKCVDHRSTTDVEKSYFQEQENDWLHPVWLSWKSSIPAFFQASSKIVRLELPTIRCINFGRRSWCPQASKILSIQRKHDNFVASPFQSKETIS